MFSLCPLAQYARPPWNFFSSEKKGLATSRQAACRNGPSFELIVPPKINRRRRRKMFCEVSLAAGVWSHSICGYARKPNARDDLPSADVTCQRGSAEHGQTASRTPSDEASNAGTRRPMSNRLYARSSS